MKAKWRRNALVGAMVVLVGAAAALNWRYAGQETQQSGTRMLGEATLVSGTGDSETVEPVPVPSADVGIVLDDQVVYTGTDYFASARLTRQQARDNAISLLQEAAQQENADEDVLNEASAGIQVLASYTLKEAQIENLVTAKGYQDCVAFMGDGSVSVVVSTGEGELSPEDVARIADIAMSETGFPASGVKILSAN